MNNPLLSGSPPRAWGRLTCERRLPKAERFTPTCVGKTPIALPVLWIGAVHPHVRGEDAHSRPPLAAPSGSPPRAWGRQWEGVEKISGLRFTPTCVGKTSLGGENRPDIPVHPHVRGEDDLRLPIFVRIERFTPTCVGKTRPSSMLFRESSVHPHVRGEDARKETS